MSIPPIPPSLQYLLDPTHPSYISPQERLARLDDSFSESRITRLNDFTQRIRSQCNEIRSENTYSRIQSLNPENNLLLRTCFKVMNAVTNFFKMARATIQELGKFIQEGECYPRAPIGESQEVAEYLARVTQYIQSINTNFSYSPFDNSILRITPLQIQDTPEDVVMLISESLTNSGALPSINIEGSAGIDAGGVRRSVLSEASQSMLTKTTSPYYTCQINPETKAFMIYPHAKEFSEKPLESPPTSTSSRFFKDLGALFYSCHTNKQFSLSLNIDSTILKAAVTLFNEFSNEITTQQPLPPQALLKLYAIFTNNDQMLEAITTYTETGESSYLQNLSEMDEKKFKASSQEKVFKGILKDIEEDYFTPTLYQKIEGAILTAKGMMDTCEEQGNGKSLIDPTSFEMSIRGDFKIEDLKSKIRRDLGASSDTTKKLETWIDQQSTNPSPLLSQWIKDKGYPDNISNVHMFLMALTGSFSLLPTDRRFQTIPNPEHSYFKFHTCHFQLDVPSQDKIKDQKNFNRVLEESIIIAMGSEGGFQFA